MKTSKKHDFHGIFESRVKFLSENIEKIKKTKNNLFNGDVAFKLYDTYGFPLDLTQDYLKNKNIGVDTLTFDKNMIQQKERARKSWKGTGDTENSKIWFDVVKNLEPTEFVGYDQIKSESFLKKIVVSNKEVTKIKTGEEGVVILNQTPFYGESGGQIGDGGNLSNDQFIFEIYNTTKMFGKYFLKIIFFGNLCFDKFLNISSWI